MKRQKVIYKIDDDGYVIWNEIKAIDENEEVPEGYIDTPLPGENEPSLHRPRWDGEKWVEDMTQEEIEELRKQSRIPTLEERIEALELFALEQIFGGLKND